MSQSAPVPLEVPPRFFATTSRGTEEVLAEELRALGIATVVVHRNGVAFGRSLEDAYRACLWSRVASRVLYPLARFAADDAARFYEHVNAVDWTEHIGPERTLAVDAAGGRSPAGPPGYLVLKTKDAIVDRVRDALGARPNVDTVQPDLRVNIHLDGVFVIVSLDFAGRGLHRRRFGRSGASAPLKENLAAALLAIAGWPARSRDEPLLDPFCGSGTLLVEAAWIALDIAPGLYRDRIGAEGWRGHDRTLWQSLRAEAAERRAAGAEREVRIAGSDASASAVETARENLARAGLAARVRVETRALGELRPPWDQAGLVVTNPPYGVRLGETGELGPLYEQLGDVLKRRFPGWTAWVLCGNPALTKRIGLRLASRHVLHNGPIECRLVEIPIAAAPVATDAPGPGWRKPGPEAAGLARRLRRNLERLRPWAESEGLTCYRIYDSDMPEYNLSVDWYDGAVRVEEYGRPASVETEQAERRLRDALLVVPEVLGVDPARVVLRVRRRRAPGEQHERRDEQQVLHEVREGEFRFLVNMTDYLDTGLFLDDRLLRRRIRASAGEGRFLNLFAYTCTASVAAAAGGARSVTSVDLSRRYLDWGVRNFELNGLDRFEHEVVRADVLRWLAGPTDGRRYDLIFLAPPTYSQSKAMREELDLERDHPRLLALAARRLAPGGEILFATNARRFVLASDELEGLASEEITAEVTPPDFERRPRLRAFSVRARPGRCR